MGVAGGALGCGSQAGPLAARLCPGEYIPIGDFGRGQGMHSRHKPSTSIGLGHVTWSSLHRGKPASTTRQRVSTMAMPRRARVALVGYARDRFVARAVRAVPFRTHRGVRHLRRLPLCSATRVEDAPVWPKTREGFMTKAAATATLRERLATRGGGELGHNRRPEAWA